MTSAAWLMFNLRKIVAHLAASRNICRNGSAENTGLEEDARTTLHVPNRLCRSITQDQKNSELTLALSGQEC